MVLRNFTGPRQRDLRFASTPFMTGFPLRSNTHGLSGLLFTAEIPEDAEFFYGTQIYTDPPDSPCSHGGRGEHRLFFLDPG